MYIKKKRKKENVFFKQKFAQHEKIRFMISKSLIWNIITLMNSSLIYILRLFNSFIMRIKLTLIFILLSSKRNEIFHNRHVSKTFLFKRKISTKIISLSLYKLSANINIPRTFNNILSNIFLLASKDRTYFRAIRKYQRFRQTYRA